MAKDSDDCEHWLLPQFLTDEDDDLFAEFKNSSNKNDGRNIRSCFGRDFQHDFAYGFGSFGPQSGLSSPVEGSTETESDDDDYITGLTQKMAHSTLQDSALATENKRGWALSGSPQSTLCGSLCVGCGCNHGSSRGSPKCPSQVASPPRMNRNDAPCDLLYAAAGEVARMRMMEGAAGFHPNKNGLVVPPRKPSPVSVPQRTPSPNLGFRSDCQTHLFYEQHLKAAQFQQLRQQEIMKQQVSGAWGQGKKFQLNQTQQMILNRGRSGNLSLAGWPTLEQSQRQQKQPQQPPGSGMRAVFLGNPPGTKRECAGTGVFLPRRFGIPAETRKKSVCSTVLLPDRVVQALNLKLEAVDTPAQPKYNGGLGPDYDAAAVRYRKSVVMAQQRRQQPLVMNQVQEIGLPQEWTY